MNTSSTKYTQSYFESLRLLQANEDKKIADQRGENHRRRVEELINYWFRNLQLSGESVYFLESDKIRGSTAVFESSPHIRWVYSEQETKDAIIELQSEWYISPIYTNYIVFRWLIGLEFRSRSIASPDITEELSFKWLGQLRGLLAGLFR